MNIPADPTNPVGRGEGVFNVNIDTVFGLIANFPRKKEYEDMFKTAEIIEKVADNIDIIYGRVKGFLFLDDRDFVCA